MCPWMELSLRSADMVGEGRNVGDARGSKGRNELSVQRQVTMGSFVGEWGTGPG